MKSNRTLVGIAIDIMAKSLGQYIADKWAVKWAGRFGTNDWSQALAARDKHNGLPGRSTATTDLQAQIRILSISFGQHGHLFDLSRTEQRFLNDLKIIRNAWAHGTEFDDSDLRRALGTCSRLLISLGLTNGEAEISEILSEIDSRQATGESPKGSSPTPDDTEPENNVEMSVAPTTPEATHGEIEVSVGHSHTINYAMAQASFQIIDRIKLDYSGSESTLVVVEATLFSDESPISSICERLVDLVPGQTVVNDFDLELEPNAFLQIDSRRQGRLVVRVLHKGVERTKTVSRVDLLPATHWPGTDTQASAELLAAFVQPQHPEVTKVLSETSDLLLERTGSSDLDGFQGGTQRVDEIVEAIFEVLSNRSIRYSNPPASWEISSLGGQHVRSAQEMFSERFGTCLDTTVLFASILEQVGINTTLWLVRGHAFLAYWRFEATSLSSASFGSDAATALFNFVSADKLRIVETTALTAEKRMPFDTASSVTKTKHAQGVQAAENLEYVVDVRQARNSGIYPLPARVVSGSGEVSVIGYQPTAPSSLEKFFKEKESRPVPMQNESESALPPRISQWKNSLLDLSLRNRLLNFTASARFTIAVPERVIGSCEDLVVDGKAVELLPEDEIGGVDIDRYQSGVLLPVDRRVELLLAKGQAFVHASSASYKTKLRRMAAEAKLINDQSGANNLYLAMGSLLWTVDNKELRSPLILIPVLLQPSGRGGRYRIIRDESGTSTPNFCLAEKLREQYNLSIPEFEQPMLDSSGIDLERTFAAITEALVAADLPFHVENSVDLGILQFAKFRMWKDLDENWESFVQAPLVRHLVESPTSEFIDPATLNLEDEDTDLDSLAAGVPLPADASQLEAVAASSGGRTFVLEGPPGTGKSQTITNLLANAMSAGKKILFVAEKRAALEVVRKRLNDVGLGAFALDLHDKGARPNAVREQIKDSIDHVVYSDAQGMKLVNSDLRAARRKLTAYAQRVHDESPSGFSAYSANNSVLVIDPEIPSLPISESFASLTDQEVISAIGEVLGDLSEIAELVQPRRRHPWGFIDSALDDETQMNILEVQERLGRGLEVLESNNHSGNYWALALTANTPGFLNETVKLLSGRISINILDQVKDPAWQSTLDSIQERALALVQEFAWITKTTSADILDVDVSKALADATEIESSGFLGIGRAKKRQQLVADIFGATWNGTEQDSKNLVRILQGLIKAQEVRAELLSELSSIPGLKVEESWNPFKPEDLDSIAVQRLQLSSLATCAQNLLGNALTEPEATALRSVLQEYNHDQSIIDSVAEVAESWQDLLALVPSSDVTIQKWAGDQGFIGLFKSTHQERNSTINLKRELARWVSFLNALEVLREKGLDEARSMLISGAYPAEHALRGFMRGTAEAALKERLDAGGLHDFSERGHLKQIDQFNKLSGDIREHLIKALPEQVGKLREPVMSEAGAKLGELQRQLNRKRGGLTVRQLMANYGDLITSIMPCVLVSPDSAARFFPPQAGLFDVVVFDEASQINVADAIGTLGRAKSAIIVGDSKQMPPTSFGASSFEADFEDDDALVVADEESILSECIQARVPRQWLSWHYRSQDESLIAFSNQQYYEGKLSSFPAPRSSASEAEINGYGVSFVRVDGKFYRSGEGATLRTNPIEAEAIADEVRRRFDASKGRNPSIGIVTFNVQQRNYIEGLIRDLGDRRMTESLDQEDDGLFVKNLENVQGDERDTILFSTAFSANDSGKLPLNFGPLNNTGGERRLNVAVTRARKQVLVFCSFDPEDLRSEESNSVGIKHLRAYLDLAAQGPRTLKRSMTDTFAPDRYRDQIANKLAERGYVIEKNVGLSDFKIDLSIALQNRPDEPLAAVLLDNEAWADRQTVGDRDGLPEQILRNVLGWPAVARVWLPAWLQDSEAVLDRISQIVELAATERTQQEESFADEPEKVVLTDIESSATWASKPEGPAVIAANDMVGEKTASIVEAEDHEEEVAPDSGELNTGPGVTGFVVYKTHTKEEPEHQDSTPDISPERPHTVWEQRTVGTVDELDELQKGTSRAKAKDILNEIALAEWPLSAKRLAKLANGAFELGKVSSAREKAMLRCLDKVNFRVDREGFVWPSNVEERNWIDYRVDFSSNGLALTDVSPREISNAMHVIVRQEGRITLEDLKRRSIAIFGYKRLTSGISSWIDKALDLAINEGRLTKHDDEIRLS